MNLQRKMNLQKIDEVTDRRIDQAQCSMCDLGWKHIYNSYFLLMYQNGIELPGYDISGRRYPVITLILFLFKKFNFGGTINHIFFVYTPDEYLLYQSDIGILLYGSCWNTCDIRYTTESLMVTGSNLYVYTCTR